MTCANKGQHHPLHSLRYKRERLKKSLPQPRFVVLPHIIRNRKTKLWGITRKTLVKYESPASTAISQRNVGKTKQA